MFFKGQNEEKKTNPEEKKISSPRADRVEVVIKVEYGNDKRKCIDFTKNISKVGLFIATPRPFEKGEVIDIKFNLPNVNYPVKVKGKVVWSRSEPEGVSKIRGMGVKFLNLSPWDEEAIKNFVEERKR